MKIRHDGLLVAAIIGMCLIIPFATNAAETTPNECRLGICDVYDNGPSTHSGGSAIGRYIAADDFVLNTNSIITGVSVDVEDGPADQDGRWDGTVEWWIMDDNDSAPGAVIASGVGQNIRHPNFAVRPSGFRNFQVEFDLGMALSLQAGQRYWLALHFQQDYDRMSVFWDYNDAIRNIASYSAGELVGGVPTFNGGPIAFDKTFRLIFRGNTVYDNGISSHDGGSSIGLHVSADDFRFNSDTILTGATVEVNDGPASDDRDWDHTIKWWILTDNDGAPGNVIASGDTSKWLRWWRTNTVTFGSGFRNFTVIFDFGREVAINGGQTYWLALNFQENLDRLSVIWDYTPEVRNNISYSGGGLDSNGNPDFTDGGPVPSERDKAFSLLHYDRWSCPDGDTTDRDEDGIFDCWEINGIDADGDGIIDLELYDLDGDGVIEDDPNGDGDTDDTERADPDHKDIYVEIDWMAQHQPNNAALTQVIQSFVQAPPENPDGSMGIRLHLQTGEQAVAHSDEVAFEPCTGAADPGIPDYDDVKADRFGSQAERTDPNSVNILNAKRLFFHYVLFAHNLQGLGSVSGCSELPGNDNVVTLGGWTVIGGHGVGNIDEQAATFMHEFGHQLNLRHGGEDNINCKPNYLSIMSYSRQIESEFNLGRDLDYSREALPTLDENNLSEPDGIGGPAGEQTVFGPPGTQTAPTDQPINWNKDGDDSDDLAGTHYNINNLGFDGCRGGGTILHGYNDWANLQYNLRNSVSFSEGAHRNVDVEITREQMAEGSPDSDGDGIVDLLDNCRNVSNADQSDSNEDGIGDECTPIADAGPDQPIECAGFPETPVQLDGSGSNPAGGDLTFTWTWDGKTASGEAPIIQLPLGTHTITLIVNNGVTDSEPDRVLITVQDTLPPHIVPPADITAECTGSGGQTIAIGAATANDACCEEINISNNAPDLFYLGDTQVAWTATDCNENVAMGYQRVAVQDSTLPEINLTVNPDTLWPPNHKMKTVNVNADASDVCDPEPVCRIISVESNETVNGIGEGDTAPDWEIIDELTVILRAERAGGGNGRVYTVEVECTDTSENSATKTIEVIVPHDKGWKK